MQDLNDMVLFARVVEHGGYSAAARALGVQTSMLSRRVAALERSLGVQLLNRSTRRMSLTEVGRQFHRHCVALADEARAAQETVERTRSVPQGLVRMSCPFALLQSNVSAVAVKFLADHPQVRLRIEATNRRVDVVEEGIDVAVRVRTLPLEDSELAVRPLAPAGAVLVAAPWFFAHHPRPSSPHELAALPTLAMGSPGERHQWHLRGPDGEALTVTHVPVLAVDHFPTLRQAALDGLGVAHLPRYVVRDDLAAGALERVLPDHGLPEGLAHAVFPSRRGLVPAVRALLDALVAGFSEGEGTPLLM